MLNTLKNWWNQEELSSDEPELKLAITKLMVGMMAMDKNADSDEYAEICRLLSQSFDLTEGESKELIEQALDTERKDLRFDRIVKQIESNHTVEERCAILSQIWKIAMADGDIDFLEEQYINRLSGLIGVPANHLNALKEEQERRFPDLNHSNRYQEPTS
ncbi:MAG: TerB family tellurite resistance protein [Ghiorsea sp.]